MTVGREPPGSDEYRNRCDGIYWKLDGGAVVAGLSLEQFSVLAIAAEEEEEE